MNTGCASKRGVSKRGVSSIKSGKVRTRDLENIRSAFHESFAQFASFRRFLQELERARPAGRRRF